MDSSFSVTLVSNLDSDSFAHNCATHFSNTLPRTIDLSEYEVSLQSTSFTDVYKKPKESLELAPQEDTKKDFFDETTSDNEIIIQETTMRQLQAEKKNDLWSNFVQKIMIAVRRFKMPVLITPFFVNGVATSVKLTYSNTEGFELYIHEPLNKILGFSAEVFEPGEHDSDLEIDIEHFNNLPNGPQGHLMEFKITKTTALLDQIQGKPDLQDLVVLIHKKLEDMGHNVNFNVKKSSSSLDFEVIPFTTRVFLSKFLNNYLGQEDFFAFHDKGTIQIPSEIISPNTRNEFYLEPPKPKSCERILLLCNLIPNQIFAGKKLPVLAIIPRNAESNEIFYEPKSLVYKPVIPGQYSQITCSFQTDRFDNLRFSTNPSIVTLNFKHKII